MVKSNRQLYIIIILLLCSRIAQAQYTFEWNDYYDNKSLEEAVSLTKTFEGNVLMLGTSNKEKKSIWLVKIDNNGKELWTKVYSSFLWMYPTKIIETHDKNYLIAASISEKDTVNHKIWLAKINPNGRILWERLYGGLKNAFCQDVIETKDKGYAVVGRTSASADDSTDWYILKVDSLGIFQWDNFFGGRYNDQATSVAELYDSSLYVAGYFTYAKGNYRKGALCRYSKDGDNLNFWDFKHTSWSMVNSLIATRDSNLVLVTEEKKPGIMNIDMSVYKLNPYGDTLWQVNLDTTFRVRPVSIIETYDEGFALSFTAKRDGIFNSNVGVVKISPDGKIAWYKIFERKSEDYAAQLIEGIDNSLMVALTDFGIDVGWNFGMLKYKSIEMSDLKFDTPKDTLLTYFKKYIPINAYITGYKKPKELKIYNNGMLLITIRDFKLVMDEIHKYYFSIDIPLYYGKNDIEFKVTDYKDYVFFKYKKIFYMPSPTRRW